jgi:hypothetical protein
LSQELPAAQHSAPQTTEAPFGQHIELLPDLAQVGALLGQKPSPQES